ncbi:hypothetical protein Bca52824_047721 [Brassica carinata]|uniref:catalase n=1 Tax=Brassica carinata TaxID=52824 RepID=A0A8X7RHT2_BRACI|nr:hypothetical protein Bca52824_047721 [Brassica carinata]
MVNGLGEDKTVMINLRQESKKPISLENLFEVAADDLQSMNDNLLSIVGAENPVLISAAEQISCAGGKKMSALVNYFPSRYDPVRHAEKYPTPPAVCYGNRERCIIEKENNFKEPGDRYSSFTPESKNVSSVDGLMFYQTLPSHMKSAASGYLTGPRLPG